MQHGFQEQAVAPDYREVNHVVNGGCDQQNRGSAMHRSAKCEMTLPKQ
jgi:hypothetical protein